MTNTNPSRFRRRAVTAAAIIAVLAGGAGVANAAIGSAATDTAAVTASVVVEQTETTTPTTDTPTTDESTTDESTTDESDDRADRPASTEEVLTGSVADQVTAAALAAVPGGTVERVETDDDGAAYEAHMTDADGNHVTVTFDESFAVLEIQQGGPGGGRGGHGGHGGGSGHGREGEEALTGDIATQVTAAAEAAVPGGTVERVETDADGAAYEAHMTDADGNRVTVTFDESFTVVEIQQGH